MGIYRPVGSYLEAPVGETKVATGDKLVLYGRSNVLLNLDQREPGKAGEDELEKAKEVQEQEEAKQVEQSKSKD